MYLIAAYRWINSSSQLACFDGWWSPRTESAFIRSTRSTLMMATHTVMTVTPQTLTDDGQLFNSLFTMATWVSQHQKINHSNI